MDQHYQNNDKELEKSTDKKKNPTKQVASILQYQYQSPLPPPEILGKYEQLHPGMIEKIIEMTEAQSKHRRAIEAKMSDTQVKHQKCEDIEAFIGQGCALLL